MICSTDCQFFYFKEGIEKLGVLAPLKVHQVSLTKISDDVTSWTTKIFCFGGFVTWLPRDYGLDTLDFFSIFLQGRQCLWLCFLVNFFLKRVIFWKERICSDRDQSKHFGQLPESVVVDEIIIRIADKSIAYLLKEIKCLELIIY